MALRHCVFVQPHPERIQSMPARPPTVLEYIRPRTSPVKSNADAPTSAQGAKPQENAEAEAGHGGRARGDRTRSQRARW